MTAAIILVIVVVVGGAGAYFGFASLKKSSSCVPPSSSVCLAGTNTHDLSVLAPIRATLQGATVPFTTILPPGETASGYNFNFGDGNFANGSTSTTVDHVYTHPGTYLVSVTATINGVTHDNYHSFVKLGVATSYASDSAGIYPTTVGSVVSNSTASAGATTIIGVGGKVTVTASYTLAPTNPAYSLAPPTMINSAGVAGTVTTTATSATGTFTFPNSGIFTVTFVGYGGSSTATPAKAYQNYTWTVAVAPSGAQYAISGAAVVHSPHPGLVISYEAGASGAKSFDPAIDYETAGGEVVYNTYQTLIEYNGSSAGPDPTNFIPVLATCVPGSVQCAALYGGNTLHQGTNFTFVINPTSQFYDPYHGGAHWGVYPTDVMFSVMRTLGFAQFPGVAITSGWILSQSLLNTGPGGIHPYFNNTPGPMFNSMSINDSRWCPAAAMTNAHGCITFHANGVNPFGNAWPFFLELVADFEGGSVQPAGWFSATAQGNGIPFWTQGMITDSGDHPVKLPGAATTTTDPAYLSAIGAIPSTGFDSWETSYVNPLTGAYAGNTQWAIVGTGPYYLAGTQVHSTYEIKANPQYVPNPACTTVYCPPSAGKYAPDVQVTWEATPTAGEQALASGVADSANIPAGDTALLLQLTQQGKVTSLVVPSITIWNVFFNAQIDAAREHAYTTTQINIPPDFFTYLGLRQFLIHAYPYASIESQILTRDGLQYGFSYGGVIPQFMGNYYPKGIPWPLTDPDPNPSDVGGAGWWWANISNAKSPYFDPELSGCTAATPCSFPLYGALSDPDGDQRMTLFINSVSSLTHGAIKMNLVDISFNQYLTEISQPLAGSGLTLIGEQGWAPDYPDPTDYVVPYYYPDSTFTYTYGTAEALARNVTQPGGAACSTSADYYLNISKAGSAFSAGFVPNYCQGSAYNAMIGLLLKAAPLAPGPQREFLYAQGEQIAFELGMVADEFQTNYVLTYGAWVDPASVNTNIMVGGSQENVWFLLSGNDVAALGAT